MRNTTALNRVLIIDSDASIRELLCRYLAQEGFAVFEANNSRDGIQIADRESPDAIILGASMLEIDVFEFVAEIKSREKISDVAIIVLTVADNDGEIRSRLRGQVQNILIKDRHNKEQILNRIGNFMGCQNHGLVH